MGKRGQNTKGALSLALSILAIMATDALASNEEFTDLYSLSLAELLSLKVNVASNTHRPAREQPNSVTIITRTEIENSDARDLQELLMRVPGFWYNIDGMFSGFSYRGIGAIEGKMLIRVDGITKNTLDAGMAQLGENIPVDMIEQVEIIRGTGSVKYGGNAEIAVINVITRSAANKDKHAFDVAYQSSKRSTLRQQYHYLNSGVYEDKSYGISLFYSAGDISDRTYTDLNGLSYEMKDKSNLSNITVNSNFRINQWHLVFQYQDRTREDETFFGDLSFSPKNEETREETALRIDYENQLSKRLSLTPSASLRYHTVDIDNDASITGKDSIAKLNFLRRRFDFDGTYSIDDTINAIFGFNFHNDEVRFSESNALGEDLGFHRNMFLESSSFSQDNSALYMQIENDLPIGILTGGIRYQYHETIGDRLIPRLSLSKANKGWHYKLMYGEGFRFGEPFLLAKSINVDQELKAETIRTYEIETGFQVTERNYLTISFFDFEINDYIALDFNTFASINLGKLATRGLEAIWLSKFYRGDINISYSYYEAKDNDLSQVNVPDQPDITIGIPQEKISATINLKLKRHSNIQISVITASPYYGNAYDEISGEPVEFKTDWLNETNLHYEHHLNNVSFGFSIKNIFDETIPYVQARNDGGYAPVPSRSRSLVATINFKL